MIKVLRDFKIKLEDELLKYWIDLIVINSEFVSIKNELKIINEDETDNKFIETAIMGDADYIVTQDKHLLNVKKYKDIKIITPDKFLRVLEK
ncbi:putative toxin-antitoxin system toxin component, PIN family [Candidatus Woesearchaeota archaeon]|nr:putative toxin-antitoxin system toxin component, PIN family [Candidatus Woesearchaeota archaeon]